MTTETERDTPAWTGWHRSNRPGAAWRAVCEGESEEEIWDLLTALVNESGDTIAPPKPPASGRPQRPQSATEERRVSPTAPAWTIFGNTATWPAWSSAGFRRLAFAGTFSASPISSPFRAAKRACWPSKQRPWQTSALVYPRPRADRNSRYGCGQRPSSRRALPSHHLSSIIDAVGLGREGARYVDRRVHAQGPGKQQTSVAGVERLHVKQQPCHSWVHALHYSCVHALRAACRRAPSLRGSRGGPHPS